MDPRTRQRLHDLLGTPVTDAAPVHGGYTPAERWCVSLGDAGRDTAFVKVGTTAYTAAMLRDEHRSYQQLHAAGADFVPALRGIDDHEDRPLLVLEDLSGARWPPPWEDGDLDRVRATIARIETTSGDFPTFDADDERTSWARIARDPAPFLSTGLCTRDWLEHALPTLLRAEADAPTEASALLHHDLRSDNLCLVDGPVPRVVLVDWNCARFGPAGLDLAYMACSVRLEGGPLPEDLGADGVFAPWVAGFFARSAGLPTIPDAPRVRWIQHRQLRIALPWAARVLGLPPPDGPWAADALSDLDARLASGALSEADWYREVEEVLADAYLSAADPRAGSGKSGDAVDWRWSRELVFDAVQGDSAAILDVGCANGHLMESLQGWGAERGLSIEAHGLEISARLAAVARRRLPSLAHRIHVGNVRHWSPPRRYDIVHTGLDYVPPGRRRALVEHILAELLVPGGRLVLRAERVGGTERDPVDQLRALDMEPHGVLERVHPVTGAVRRTAWVAAHR